MAAAYGKVRARTLFTPAQQAVMDKGGNYAGYAVVDGHFTYVGEGRSGRDAYYAVHPDQRPAPAAAPGVPDDSVGMEGIALAPAPVAPPVGPTMQDSPVDPTNPVTDPSQPVAPTAAATAKADAQHNAYGLVLKTLSDYGLPESLAQWAWEQIVAGRGQDEVLLDLQDRQEFKDEFPEIEARKKAGLTAISPAYVVNYRQQAARLMRAAGLPEGFYDSKQDFQDLLTKDVSLNELGDRIAGAAHAAFTTDPVVRQEWRNLGFGDGDLTALWLNPDVAQPLLEKRTAAAQLSGTAVRSGFGGLQSFEALDLADQGVDPGQAQAGFGRLTQQRELFSPLDSGESTISRQEQLDAGVGGNAAAQARIEERARRRRAQFSGGGSFAAGQQGMTGLGSNSR